MEVLHPNLKILDPCLLSVCVCVCDVTFDSQSRAGGRLTWKCWIGPTESSGSRELGIISWIA